MGSTLECGEKVLWNRGVILRSEVLWAEVYFYFPYDFEVQLKEIYSE